MAVPATAQQHGSKRFPHHPRDRPLPNCTSIYQATSAITNILGDKTRRLLAEAVTGSNRIKATPACESSCHWHLFKATC